MKKVLVTGGTRGIGREIAREFLRRGFFVCAAYSSDEQSAAESAAEGIDVFRADVSDEGQVRALFGHVGNVDILVNNAGISLFKQIQDVSFGEWNRLFAVNVGGAFLCAREASRAMIEKRAGSSSTFLPFGERSAGAAKASIPLPKPLCWGLRKLLQKSWDLRESASTASLPA